MRFLKYTSRPTANKVTAAITIEATIIVLTKSGVAGDEASEPVWLLDDVEFCGGVEVVEFKGDDALGVVVEEFMPMVIVCVSLQSLDSPVKTYLNDSPKRV